MLETNDTSPEFTSVVTPSAIVPAASDDLPQFATAEYAHVPGSERCRICSSFLSSEYYRVNGQMACGKCAGQAREGQPADTHAAFARALLLGIGAAVLGLIIYSAFGIVTGWTIGYLALAVGWLVGKGMIKGSNGLGGRRYQVVAVILTYASISLSAVPIGISYVLRHRPAAVQKRVAENPFPDDPAAQAPPVQSPPPRHEIHWGALAGQLLLTGLASPFLGLAYPAQGAIGLFILFIGLRIAWQLTAAKPLDVDGPYTVVGA